ncbi:hypothetical protein Syun_021006 [Stephania yunnanensis]|uniref:Uncharacterized protein n=1 Tax=Stephania yunnanensis TaxID=152371 RepID=A0AAP0IEW7_9MAGN
MDAFNEYAISIGFGIKSRASYKKKGVVWEHTFACVKEGWSMSIGKYYWGGYRAVNQQARQGEDRRLSQSPRHPNKSLAFWINSKKGGKRFSKNRPNRQTDQTARFGPVFKARASAVFFIVFFFIFASRPPSSSSSSSSSSRRVRRLLHRLLLHLRVASAVFFIVASRPPSSPKQQGVHQDPQEERVAIEARKKASQRIVESRPPSSPNEQGLDQPILPLLPLRPITDATRSVRRIPHLKDNANLYETYQHIIIEFEEEKRLSALAYGIQSKHFHKHMPCSINRAYVMAIVLAPIHQSSSIKVGFHTNLKALLGRRDGSRAVSFPTPEPHNPPSSRKVSVMIQHFHRHSSPIRLSNMSPTLLKSALPSDFRRTK